MSTDEKYMQRCLQLAKLGNGYVAPNPMVGAVLVYNHNIIGEGFHEKYGSAHAEVNCINSVSEINKNKIPFSTLYVSLEPCNHFGKTPPCTSLIVKHKIKKVVIGCTDTFNLVNGSGINFLKENGVEVVVNVFQHECETLNKNFFTFHQKKRPYIILKYAQSTNNKIASHKSERTFISNYFSNNLVHRWRSEEAAILVGTTTALKDNPALTNRLGYGNNPVRLVIDKHLQIPTHYNLLDNSTKTIIFNFLKDDVKQNTFFVKLNMHENVIHQIVQFCTKNNLISILVEGGTNLLQSFINQNLWDEARVITNNTLFIEDGVDAPNFNGQILNKISLLHDTITFYTPQ